MTLNSSEKVEEAAMPAGLEDAAVPPPATRRESPAGIFFRKPIAIFFLVVLAGMVLIAIFGPVFGGDPVATGNPSMQPPSADHLLGTDHLGRDYLARVLHGGRTSLFVGFSVAALCMTLGVVVGSLAGFYGGVIDVMLVKIIEFFQAIPGLVLALVAAAILGANVMVIIAILAVTMWTGVARIMRAEAARIAQLGYVESSRSAGFPGWRILWSDVLPNAMAPVVVTTTMTVGTAILVESGLAYLGIGDANRPTWGSLLNDAQPYLNSAWWLALFPGLCIFLVVLAVNMLGDALNDALNPTIGRVK
ncbi:ABC transporter permease [Phytoactinopolyspora endophytica]|uniref:ABC transporter permease n=1 Tax=Phytoactinopolyspora endophytica TaxID=1642495 RepID=UPI00101B6D67|nr:ABC transporter permease [Phytoactinopolyspora endophytica]